MQDGLPYTPFQQRGSPPPTCPCSSVQFHVHGEEISHRQWLGIIPQRVYLVRRDRPGGSNLRVREAHRCTPLLAVSNCCLHIWMRKIRLKPKYKEKNNNKVLYVESYNYEVGLSAQQRMLKLNNTLEASSTCLSFCSSERFSCDQNRRISQETSLTRNSKVKHVNVSATP